MTFLWVISRRELGSCRDYIGSFMEYDASNNYALWKEYMRIRMAIDVRFSFKKSKKVKSAGGIWSSVAFKYERLPSFFFVCRLSHTDLNCLLLIQFHKAKKEVTKEWTVDIHTPMRKAAADGDGRWLRDGEGGEVVSVEEEDVQVVVVDRGENYEYGANGKVENVAVVGIVDSTCNVGRSVMAANLVHGENSSNVVTSMELEEHELELLEDKKRRRGVVSFEAELHPRTDPALVAVEDGHFLGIGRTN